MKYIDVPVVRRWMGPCLGIAAFLAYVCTVCPGVPPGPFSSFVLDGAGLIPRSGPEYPLWRLLAWLVSRVGIGALAVRLNLLSAVFGALVVWLLYRITRDLLYMAVGSANGEVQKTDREAVLLGGLGSAAFLAASLPFWLASTRAHVATFDLFLLLVVVTVLLRYERNSRLGAAFLFSLLYLMIHTQ